METENLERPEQIAAELDAEELCRLTVGELTV